MLFQQRRACPKREEGGNTPGTVPALLPQSSPSRLLVAMAQKLSLIPVLLLQGCSWALPGELGRNRKWGGGRQGEEGGRRGVGALRRGQGWISHGVREPSHRVARPHPPGSGEEKKGRQKEQQVILLQHPHPFRSRALLGRREPRPRDPGRFAGSRPKNNHMPLLSSQDFPHTNPPPSPFSSSTLELLSEFCLQSTQSGTSTHSLPSQCSFFSHVPGHSSCHLISYFYGDRRTVVLPVCEDPSHFLPLVALRTLG